MQIYFYEKHLIQDSQHIFDPAIFSCTKMVKDTPSYNQKRSKNFCHKRACRNNL